MLICISFDESHISYNKNIIKDTAMIPDIKKLGSNWKLSAPNT